jgi:trafficking protein particle complex subunit 8
MLSPVSAAAAGDGRMVSPMSSTVVLNSVAGKHGGASGNSLRDLIQCGFVPYIGVVSSEDVDALLHARGFGRRSDGRNSPDGAFLELIRPFGEIVAGRVTIRDSSMGSSRTYDDYGVRFFGMARSAEAKTGVMNGSAGKKNAVELGGNVAQIEEVVDRHLNFAELRPSASHEFIGLHDDPRSDILSEPSTVIHNQQFQQSPTISPFYSLFLRRMLSNHPLSPHETFAHPVACVIAISSRNPSPIEEFKKLYESTNVGAGQGNRLPHWVNNDFLRYYVLVHDDDNGDIQKSTQLYEQMKRHFGLHCHLLRLRSVECVPSDDDSVRLPACDWMSAAEELGNIQNRGEIIICSILRLLIVDKS